ncbi:unnamed protein product, partial [Cylicostephanus goldi]
MEKGISFFLPCLVTRKQTDRGVDQYPLESTILRTISLPNRNTLEQLIRS